jgi:hypothetical protein
MENELTVLEQAIAKLTEVRAEAITVIRAITAKEEDLRMLKVQLDARKDGLDVREIEVKKIEDVVALKEEAQKLMKEAKKDMEVVEDKQRNFNAHVEQQTKELREWAQRNTEAQQANEREGKALREAMAALQKEKREFKTKLGEALIENATKNT